MPKEICSAESDELDAALFKSVRNVKKDRKKKERKSPQQERLRTMFRSNAAQDAIKIASKPVHEQIDATPPAGCDSADAQTAQRDAPPAEDAMIAAMPPTVFVDSSAPTTPVGELQPLQTGEGLPSASSHEAPIAQKQNCSRLGDEWASTRAPYSYDDGDAQWAGLIEALGVQDNGSMEMSELHSIADQAAKVVTSQARTEDTNPEELKLEKDIGDGIPARSATGQQFFRDSNGGKNYAYRALASNAERQAFRIEWANKRLQAMRETKTKSESLTKQDIERGTYLPFDLVVDAEGGAHRPAAIRAARNYIRKCLAMQGPWVSYNAMTERFEFLHYRRQVLEVFERCWSHHVEMSTTTNPEAATNKRASPETDGQPPASPVPKQPRPTPGNPTTPTTTPTPKTHSAYDKACARAKKTKQQYEVLTSRASSLTTTIKTQPGWAWANFPQSLHGLTSTYAQLQASLTNFAMDFLTQDIKEVKNKYDAKSIEAECVTMSDSMDPILRTLDREVKYLLLMHNARFKATNTP